MINSDVYCWEAMPPGLGYNVDDLRVAPFLKRCVASLDALALSLPVLHGAFPPTSLMPKTYSVNHGKIYTLILPVYSFLSALVLQGGDPSLTIQVVLKGVKVEFAPNPFSIIETNVLNYMDLFFNTVTVQFLNFYETYVDVVNRHSSYNRDKWSETWKFARVVRNAITHSGTVNISDRNFKDVEWRNIVLGHIDNSRPLFEYMTFTEVFLLMLDMDLALCGVMLDQAGVGHSGKYAK